MPNLDQFQMEVVTSKENLLVIAGPGSGKTTTIIAKVNYLINANEHLRILLISFTNKSVDDIKSRLTVSGVDVMTFHKLAIDILKCYNINYQICSENLLSYIIEEYFKTIDKNTYSWLCKTLDVLKVDDEAFMYLNLKKLIITFISIFKTNNHDFDKLKNLINEYKDKTLLQVIFNILKRYEEEKKSMNLYDFDDLIVYATDILKKSYQYKKYDYIIVDEFQDTSLIRLNLIKEIYINCKAIITAVGDDAQSIFHFSGCDLNIFLNFNNYFPNTKTVFLKNTYRNSQEIINISERFINKNPNQLKKGMQSPVHIHKPVKLVYYYFPKKVFKKTLDTLINKSTDILIISRNYKDIYEYIDEKFELKNDQLTYQNNTFRYLTIHSAKGLEATYVILLNLADKKYGLPSKVINHSILKYLESDIDKYPYAEERRVFFVAITRCKIKTYILVPRKEPSIFIKEIKKHL